MIEIVKKEQIEYSRIGKISHEKVRTEMGKTNQLTYLSFYIKLPSMYGHILLYFVFKPDQNRVGNPQVSLWCCFAENINQHNLSDAVKIIGEDSSLVKQEILLSRFCCVDLSLIYIAQVSRAISSRHSLEIKL